MDTKRVVVATGGAGYIGSHVVAALLEAGDDVIIVDNFENAARDVPRRIAAIGAGTPAVIEADCRDPAAMDAVFAARSVDALIHLAGRRSAPESVQDPFGAYDSNVGGALAVFRAAAAHGVRDILFSSSAAVYGAPRVAPTPETEPAEPASPYGRSKRMAEMILADVAAADRGIGAISLRYFNAAGAHPSMQIGETPRRDGGNLFTSVVWAAEEGRAIEVFGDDYDTPDGTAVRDYIHVCDLARGHLTALDALSNGRRRGHEIFNLGAGRGYSVREVIDAFAAVSSAPASWSAAPRRPGDLSRSTADPSRVAAELGWRAEFDLDRMCRDHWAFRHAGSELAATATE